MAETKPFSRSLKRLIAHDYLQQQDISHFLAKPNPELPRPSNKSTRLQTEAPTHTHSPLARAAKVRSRFETKIDEIVGQVMKEQELPLIDNRKGPLITRKQQQNLRIST
jgi:predicted secreted protein